MSRRRRADHRWLDERQTPEVVIGWRLWRVVGEHPDVRLTAWSSAALPWPARGRAEARCLLDLPDTHLPPQPGCRCGLHAFARRESAEAALAAELLPGPCALGRVSLWGRTVKHAGGWRSQFGYPYDLFVVGGDSELLRALRAAYAVDVDELQASDLVRRVRREHRRRVAERTGRPLWRPGAAGPALGTGPA